MALLTAVLLLSLLGIDWRKEAIKARLRMQQFGTAPTSDRRRKSDANRNNSARINSSNSRRQSNRFDSFINEDSSTNGRRDDYNEGEEEEENDEEGDDDFGSDGGVEDLQDSIGDQSDRRVGAGNAVHIRAVAASSFSATTFNILHYPSAEEELAELEMVEFTPARF